MIDFKIFDGHIIRLSDTFISFTTCIKNYEQTFHYLILRDTDKIYIGKTERWVSVDKMLCEYLACENCEKQIIELDQFKTLASVWLLGGEQGGFNYLKSIIN